MTVTLHNSRPNPISRIINLRSCSVSINETLEGAAVYIEKHQEHMDHLRF